jgi:hypothetical protein
MKQGNHSLISNFFPQKGNGFFFQLKFKSIGMRSNRKINNINKKRRKKEEERKRKKKEKMERKKDEKGSRKKGERREENKRK